MNPNKSHTRVLYFITLLVLGFLAVLSYIYLTSFQKVNISFADKSTALKASIYKIPSYSQEVDLGSYIRSDALVKVLSEDKTLKLKKGWYVITTDSSNTYSSQRSLFSLNRSEQFVKINPPYNSEKLNNMLNQSLPEVTQVLNNTIPGFSANYKVKNSKLYDKGDWFGGTITQKVTDEQARLDYFDTYRFVAQKIDGKWILKTLPPELILSSKKYRDIPHDILVDVNKL